MKNLHLGKYRFLQQSSMVVKKNYLLLPLQALLFIGNTEKFVQVIKAISPTFGVINLEDIKAPEAFKIEEKLKNDIDIPIIHSDQHGTATISGAALINSLELTNRNIKNVKMSLMEQVLLQ